MIQSIFSKRLIISLMLSLVITVSFAYGITTNTNEGIKDSSSIDDSIKASTDKTVNDSSSIDDSIKASTDKTVNNSSSIDDSIKASVIKP